MVLNFVCVWRGSMYSVLYVKMLGHLNSTHQIKISGRNPTNIHIIIVCNLLLIYFMYRDIFIHISGLRLDNCIWYWTRWLVYSLNIFIGMCILISLRFFTILCILTSWTTFVAYLSRIRVRYSFIERRDYLRLFAVLPNVINYDNCIYRTPSKLLTTDNPKIVIVTIILSAAYCTCSMYATLVE